MRAASTLRIRLRGSLQLPHQQRWLAAVTMTNSHNTTNNHNNNHHDHHHHLLLLPASYSTSKTHRSVASQITTRCFHNTTISSQSNSSDDNNNNSTSSSSSSAAPTDAPATDATIIEYSTPELTVDAARHKAGLEDPTRPSYQNPLHHNLEQPLFREDFDSEQAFVAAQIAAPPVESSDQATAATTTTTSATPLYIQELADDIVQLTLLEMNELVNKIGQHYGFNENMLSPEDAAGGDEDTADDDADTAAAAPAKTVFDLKLVSFDDKTKIKVIKEVRSIAGLGLKEAKEMVEGAPKIFLKQIKQEQADEIKAKLEELGAVIEIV